MAKKLEKIGNYLVVTDTITGVEVINEHSMAVTFHVNSNTLMIRSTKDDRILGEKDGFTLAEVADSDGNQFANLEAVKTWLRSNTGFNLQAFTGEGGGVRVDEEFSVFPPTGEEGFIYVAEDTGQMYIWNGSEYTAVGGGTLAAPTVKTLYESNEDTEAFNTASKTKVDFITVTEAVDLDAVVEAGSGTITSPNTGNGNSGNAPGHTMTSSIPGLWFMIDDDSSGLDVDMFNGDLVNNYPAAGTYNLQIAFRGYEHTSTTQTLILTIT